MAELSKKEIVTAMLKEIEKVIHKAIDDGRVEPYTPLDLIYMATNEIIMVAQEMQNLTDDFENNDIPDDDRGGVQ